MLKTLPSDSIDCIVTSPPYFQLRQYLGDDHPDKLREIGREPTVDAFVATMVAVFEECRRVLKPTGTCWLNLGDSYGGSGGYAGDDCPSNSARASLSSNAKGQRQASRSDKRGTGIKSRDLCLIPYRVAIALQQAGWWVRSNIVWHKPAPMPESVRNRPTCAHETVFLLTKRENGYAYDWQAVAEPCSWDGRSSAKNYRAGSTTGRVDAGMNSGGPKTSRNLRNVWSITNSPSGVAHYATMPRGLAERCVKAGCPVGGVVLDPFGGAGTTALVANGLGRDAILIELSAEYAEIARQRCEIGDGQVTVEAGAVRLA